MNQLARGKTRAFADFRDVLAHQMEIALPELRGDVKKVVEATGGPGPRGHELGICGRPPVAPSSSTRNEAGHEPGDGAASQR